MEEMKFEVAYMPKEVKEDIPQVCVLVDVLRATTAMITMLDKGCSEIILTDDERKTLGGLKGLLNQETLVCAEDLYGNVSEYAQFSPSLISINDMDLKEKRVVLKTTNGTLAGLSLWKSGNEHILVGSLRNAKAVMNKAVKMADELGTGVVIVCAGRENGQIAALDDVYTAGVLLDYGRQAATALKRIPLFKDSAKISTHLLSNYQDTIHAFEDSGSGETMRRIGCEEDIKLCAEENLSNLAPVLEFTEGSSIVVKNINEVIYK
ncbi:2-phosphosulfolactate phosphatase [Bacillus sp. Marseille-Q3570]|uniref:2-phosphosulfolactate phosphatase n=1 Tax=Bacillus sp. Marseille-Q3570 TaxID=2963522 RepID=UPI0021B75A6D|nr:2-phosphosulfolactate phosphatase [Bacillus sp. Marseille-Q3570]